MGCREWGTELSDWALDELSPAKVRELEQHLEQCEECARSAQRLLGVRQALKSSLTDFEMPAHLVFAGEKPQSPLAGFWAALLRTAALSAAAAATFLVVASVGLRYGGARLLPVTAWAKPAMTQTEFQTFITKAVADEVSLQSKEMKAATTDQVAALRQAQVENWARIARQLQYLELAEYTQWKETQQQNKVISSVARYQQLPTGSPAER
jgi:anti-sigma factor RsiW